MTQVRNRKGPNGYAVLLAMLVLLPLFIALPPPLGGSNAKGASDCQYDAQGAAQWHSEVSSFNMSGEVGGDDYEYRDGDEEVMVAPGSMWWESLDGDNIYNKSELQALRSDFHTSFIVDNDSTSGLRLNLTHGYRYTFCFVVHSVNQSAHLEAPLVDFYLIQEYDWDLYRNDFETRVWEDRDMLDLIPPEWRDLVAWMPYRDVHSYEGKRQLDFTVSLDSDETSGAFFGFSEPQTQWMYLLIDGWDNMRDSDTPAPHRNFSVDVTVMTEERLTLPKFTVSLVCCGLFLSMLAAPVLMHTKFVSAGKDGGAPDGELTRLMEKEATKPAATIGIEDRPPPQA